MVKICLLNFLTLLILLNPTPTSAQEVGQSLSFRILGLEDQSKLTIQSICCGNKKGGAFGAPVLKTQTNYGGDVFWLKLEKIPGDGLIQFSPIVDEVVLYARSRGDTSWQISTTGDTVANNKKPFATPFMALPLPKQVDVNNIYARISQPTLMSINVKHWTLPPFIAMQENDRTVKLILMGFVLAIVIHNILFSWLVRDFAFFLNAITVCSLGGVSLYLTGYGSTYVWASYYQYTNILFNTFIWFGVISGSAFFYMFLKTQERPLKSFWPIFIAPALTLFLTLLLSIFQAPYWLFSAAFTGTTILLFIVIVPFTIKLAFEGEKRAQILLVPLIFAILPGLILLLMEKIGGVSLFSVNTNTVEITLTIEAVLFSLALVSRIRITETTSIEATRNLLKVREKSAAIAISAQDAERKRLSKELHDGIGQELLLVVSRMKKLARSSTPKRFTQTINELVMMSSNIMINLRRISQDMHPASIEHLGLVGTISSLIDQFNEAGPIKFEHDLVLEDSILTQSAQFHLVRIIQESMTNVVKHSGATQCKIFLRSENNQLKLYIEDDGIGMETDDSDRNFPFGLGLNSVNERVCSLGGQWRVTKNLMGGLTIVVIVLIDKISQIKDTAQ